VLARAIVRSAPAGEDAAGYVAIAGDDRLVGLECACAARVEIHRIVRSADDVSMEAAESLETPVEIRPGSDLHLMLMSLRAPLVAGETVELVLRFERTGLIRSRFVVVDDTRAAWAAFSD
jgi:copper(I)-binding protein